MSEENGATTTEEVKASHNRTEETANLLTASLDSMTPAIVQRMTATVAKMAELVDVVEAINNDEMKNLVYTAAEAADSLSRSLEAVQALEESGALKALTEMADFVYAMKQSMTTPIVTRTLATGISLAVTGDQMLEAARESVNVAKKDTRKLGPMALLNELKDPQVQDGLKFILAFAKRMPGVLESL